MRKSGYQGVDNQANRISGCRGTTKKNRLKKPPKGGGKILEICGGIGYYYNIIIKG